jgi:hypothetical protein
VAVKLQAHPGNFAGGLFGCRTMKRAGARSSESLLR